METDFIPIHFILVEPAVPENVGAAARAIKTMGFESLRLVNPCEFVDGKARWLAHASGEILDNALVYTSLADALKDVDFVIASSAKSRSVKGDHHPAEKIPAIINEKSGSVNSVAIVFGREESGLSNDELSLCHISTYIPMAAMYPSLNLAQAVMIYAYLLSKLNIQAKPEQKEVVQESKYKAMKHELELLLSNTKIEKNQILYRRIFERVALLGDNDINLLMSVLASLKEKYENH
ncbi:MAG: tRNA/rRNA methyltransferase [Bacteroidales bacterium]|nr:tRNA/rRNA methyltransferase [Bacteroidales bacterium]